MKTEHPVEGLIPPALLEQVEALAAAERRPASDMLREAVEGYLQKRRALAATNPQQPRRTAQEAAARILERRKHHLLPEGETIRDLMTYGRA
jgi:hypothetical protein